MHFKGDYAKAASMLNEALTLSDDGRIYMELGHANKHLNKPRAAAKAYVNAALRRDESAVKAFLNAIMTLEKANLQNEADEVYQTAFKWHRDNKKWVNEMFQLYTRRHNYLIDHHLYPELISLLEEQIELMDQKGVGKDADVRIRITARLASCACAVGRSDLLVQYGPQLVAILESVPQKEWHKSVQTTWLLDMLSTYFFIVKDYTRAEQVLQALIKVETTHSNKANNLTSYANFLSQTGRTKCAIELYNDAFNEYLKAEMPSTAIFALQSKAYLAKEIDDSETLKQSIEEMTGMIDKITEYPDASPQMVFEILHNYAIFLTDAGYTDDAEDIIEQSIAQFDENKYPLLVSKMLNNLGYIYLNTNRASKASACFNKALTLIDYKLSPDIERSIINNAAIAFKRQNKTSEAVNLYYSLLKRMRSIVNEDFIYMTDNERHDFWLQQYYIFDNIHGMPVKTPGIGQLRYEAALINKGILLDNSARLRSNIQQSGDSVLSTSFDHLVKTAALPRNEHNSAEIIRLEREIQQRAAAIGLFTPRADASLADVCARLGKTDIAIEIIRHYKDNKYVYDALICNKRGQVFIEPLPSQAVLDALDPANTYSGKNTFAKDFWDPILKHCPKDGNIYISPDGAYNNIAFEHLPVNGTPMSRMRRIFRVASTRVLPDMNAPKGSIALWGGLNYNTDIEYDNAISSRNVSFLLGEECTPWNYLPGTAKEIAELGTLAHSASRQVSSFTLDEGTEQAFKQQSGNSANIIHIATHGFYIPDNDNPAATKMQRSGLILAGANNVWIQDNTITEGNNDGIITASEISHLDLSTTDLVVLSACQSGLGDIDSEGIFGLQRAFMQSGVKRIVMTLWPVDDEATQRIMSAFYKRILEGIDLHQALSEACIQEGSDNPLVWAPFVILN